jgi:hypothetical protein
MAVRYDQKKKDEVVAFILNFNEKNGRGGQSAAAKKYKVTPITISNWLKKAGVKGKNKKKKTGPKPGPKKKGAPRGPRKSSGSKSSILGRLMKIQTQIESLEAEYEDLKNRL